jgi:hypothetical protein
LIDCIRAWARDNAHVPIGFNRATGLRTSYLRCGATSLFKVQKSITMLKFVYR